LENIGRRELANILLFEGIEPTSVLGLLEDCPVICLAENEVLISQGEINSCCYFILSGQLRIHLDSLAAEPFSILLAGESVGEMSLLDSMSASAYVVCHAGCELLVLNENVFWSLVNASHNFSRNLLFLLTRRLRGNNISVSENLKKQQEYKLDATIDELTGLYNRRWLKNILTRQMNRSQRNSEPLSLLMIDVDHFKRVNDNYGHLAGDQVLRAIARIMVNHVRPTDLVARYGGEEFITVLPDINLTAAKVVANRMCRAVSAADMVTAEGTVLPTVTISIGLARMRAGDSMDEFIRRADAALYLAKKKGRDRVEG
jgi:diguanylate cyclase (GGDEF)-like protein